MFHVKHGAAQPFAGSVSPSAAPALGFRPAFQERHVNAMQSLSSPMHGITWAKKAVHSAGKESRAMIYELTTMSSGPLALGTLSQAALAWMTNTVAAGRLLGLWHSEIGPVGEVIALRAFCRPDEAQRERERTLLCDDPIGCRALGARFTMQSYRSFPFLPDVSPADRGGIYEIRTYHLRPGGLGPTMRGWERALQPASEYTDHLVTNMYALDGAPRITHIWGFSSLEERAALRAKHYRERTWPPPGGPDEIIDASSRIVIPAAGSLLT